jgi:hypothetical protein
MALKDGNFVSTSNMGAMFPLSQLTSFSALSNDVSNKIYRTPGASVLRGRGTWLLTLLEKQKHFDRGEENNVSNCDKGAGYWIRNA